MLSFFQRIGLKKRRPGKDTTKNADVTEKLGKTKKAVDATTSAPGNGFTVAPTTLAPRRSFESRASGSVISIPRAPDTSEDFDDLKPWKKKKNKGKQAHRDNARTVTEQMRENHVALRDNLDRMEAHVVPYIAPPDAFTIDEKDLAVATNHLRTWYNCAAAIYEEGKESNTPTDSVSETPDDIRNNFVNALEQCKDPEFLFRLSSKILRKYDTGHNSKGADTGSSEPRDTRTNGISRARSSSQLRRNQDVPRLEYPVAYETAACEPQPSEILPATQLQLANPDSTPRKLIPIDTLLLHINSEKRQRGELMPHLQVPFGPSHPTIGQADRALREPKYLGLHELYAENCIEKLTVKANEMAQLPRPYTENVALEPTGARPQIEATVSQPNALSKPIEPSFKSSVEDLGVDDTTFETLPLSKFSSTLSHGSIAQKPSGGPDVSLGLFENPVVFPIRFGSPTSDEIAREDEQSSSQRDLAVRTHDRNPQQAYQLALLESRSEEQQVQIPNTESGHMGGEVDTDRISTSSECGSSCPDDSETEEDSEDEDEAAAQLSAIHLLILLKVLAKRQNESQSLKQTDRSTSNQSSSPSDSSEASQGSSSSSTVGQNLSIPNRGGDSSGGSSRKRSRENDKDNNGNDPNGPPRKKATIEVMRDVLRRLACPLARGRPSEYPGCQMINRQNLSGLKEHVKRKHFHDVLPDGIRKARNWDEVFLYCNQGWTGPIPSPYISDMFRIANDNQPLNFEPSLTESSASDGIYRPIAPLLASPALAETNLNADASGLLEPMVQIHNHHAGTYGIGPKEPTVGQEMINLLATEEFRGLLHILPPHLQSISPDEFETLDLENYMQTNFGINVNQVRSQMMSPEFANNLNMLFQQPGAEGSLRNQPEIHQRELVLPSPASPPSMPTIQLQTERPEYDNPNSEPPLTSETSSEQNIGLFSAELSHGLDYLFTDAKPYLKTQRPKSRFSTSSLSSSSTSHPSSSSSSVLIADPGTLTPDTLLSERDLIDLPLSPKSRPPNPIKKSRGNKKYTLRIRHKPPGPKKYSAFSFNDDNEYMELKLDFGAWMTQSFFPDTGFSWETWELEDTVYHERISSTEELIQTLQFTWTAYRTTEAAFFLVSKE